MSFIKKILNLLIAIILTFYTGPSKGDYFDILYNGSHSLAVLSCTHNICLTSNKDDKNYGIGAGVGYIFGWHKLILLTGKEADSYNIEFKSYYNDKKLSYFAGVKYEFSMRKTRFEIGAGYPINEKLHIIAKHSYGVTSVGVRRYF